MRSTARVRPGARTIRQTLGILVGTVALIATAPAVAWAAPTAQTIVYALPVRPLSAAAHTSLRDSTPRANSRVREVPNEVLLEFTAAVRARVSQVIVRGPDGVRYELGAPHSVGTKVRQLLRPLVPTGGYQVGYRVVAADGHPVAGTIGFTLTKPGPGAGAPTGAAGSGRGPAPAAPSHSQAPAGLATGAVGAAGARPSGGPVTRYPVAPSVRPAKPTRAAGDTGGTGGAPPWALVIGAIVAVAAVTGAVVFCRRVTRDLG